MEFYNESLKIATVVKGKYSIDVAQRLNNLGLLYCDQGDYLKALEYH